MSLTIVCVSGLMKYVPDRCSVLAKKQLLYAGTFGLGAWLCGIVFVDRENKERARGTMSSTAQTIHDRNVNTSIYGTFLWILWALIKS